MNKQLSMFDIHSFDYLLKDKIQNERDILIKKGSGFAKGKLRILAFYNLNNPTNQEFANFLKNEYGQGGCSNGIYSEQHGEKGISISFKNGATHFFKWTDFSKMVAESIKNDEYIEEKDIPKTEFFEAKHQGSNYTHLMKTYDIVQGYDGNKLVTAHLSSCTQEQVTTRVEVFSNLYSHVDIGIHELINGIETGVYDNEFDIWEDIKNSLRRVSPSVFGGKKWLDEQGIAGMLADYKKKGYIFNYLRDSDIDHKGTFYNLRRRVNNGELSKEFLKRN